MTVGQHRLKDSVGICLAAIGPLGGRAVHPPQNDHSRSLITEKEAVLLKELGPVPMAVLRAEGGTLAVFVAAGVLGDVVEHPTHHRSQRLVIQPWMSNN